MQVIRTGFFLAGLIALPALAPAVAAPMPASEANLVLLEVRLGNQLLSDAVNGYEIGRDVYLPLGE